MAARLLEDLTARKHDIPASFAVRGDAELEDTADEVLGSFHAAQVHLGERAKGAQAPHGHLVAAFDHGRHPALDGDARGGRHRERLPIVRSLSELVGQAHLVSRRDDRRLDLVADPDAQPPLVVGQLTALDPGLALATDIDEDALRPDEDDAALHHLADLQSRRGLLAGEQRGEILGRRVTLVGHVDRLRTSSAAVGATVIS